MNYFKRWCDKITEVITEKMKPAEEVRMVKGDPSGWVKRCYIALEAAGFNEIEFNQMLFRLSAKYKKIQAQGSMRITISSDLNDNTTIHKSITGSGLFNARTQYVLAEFEKNMNWNPIVEGIDFQKGDTTFLSSIPTTTTVAGGSEGFFLRFMNCGCGIVVIVIVLGIFGLLSML